MELKINLDYNQILNLIHQLSDKDKKKLAVALQSEVSSKKTTESIRELILKAPTWSEGELNAFQAVRNYINKSRIA